MFRLFKVLFIAILPVLVIFTMAGSINTRIKYQEQIDNGTMTEQEVNDIIKNTPYFQKFILGLGATNNIIGDSLITRLVKVGTESNIFNSNNYTDILTSLRTIGSFIIFTPRIIYEIIAYFVDLLKWWNYAFTIRA